MPLRPRLKLAIIGGGPSAFFSASRLLQLLPQVQSPSHSTPAVAVHIYDRLWAPHGLVRYGVAPDHPEVKNCTNKFDDAARDPRLRFFGNVNISTSMPPTPSSIPHALDVPLSSLLPHYSHILIASGCTVPRLHPSLPPSSHTSTPFRIFPALDLVHWYTEHPSRRDEPPPPLLESEHVSVIGQGNVALDIARMLLAPLSHLDKYDVPKGVLDVLRNSKVRHVSIIGRRGPREAAFTTKELREMMTLPSAAMAPLDRTLMEEAVDESVASGGPLTRQQKRLLDLMMKGSKNTAGSVIDKTWSLDFFRSPVGVSLSSNSNCKMDLSLAHTALSPASSGTPATRKAIPTGHTSTLSTDLIYTSLGYTSSPVDAFYDPSLSHIRNVGGRVIDADGKLMEGVYASGWAAMGAKGVLAATMLDAHTVVDTIISDLQAQTAKSPSTASAQVQTTPIAPMPGLATSADPSSFIQLLNPKADLESIPAEVMDGIVAGNVMDYPSWKRVDAEEIHRGSEQIVSSSVRENEDRIERKERERMGWEEARTFIRNPV